MKRTRPNGVFKIPPVFAPGDLNEDYPKALLCDIAWNFAMKLADDNPDEARNLILNEADRVAFERKVRKP